ncbi:MAG TPA: MFS transporter [Thermoanaerobaculia bacterium]|nr:MFS transporter [Thermoanaerobaculia bacterium]
MSSAPAVSEESAAPNSGPASEPAPAPPPRVRHPLTLPHFRSLWIGSTISLLGDQFYLVALPWLVLQITGSRLALGTILMTAAVPRAVFMLLGGAVTDRISARRVLIGTAVTRTVLVGAVAALIWFQKIELWELYVLTFAFGVADAFSFPAGGALVPTLVEPEQLRPANALFQGSTVLTQMAGPAPAGFLISAFGVASALFFDALSFLGVIVALFKVPEPPKAPKPQGGQAGSGMLHSIAEGLRAVRRDPALLSLMFLFGALNFCVAGPIGVGLAVMAKDRFHSAVAFGTFLSCFSAGMLVGIVLGGRVKKPRRRGLQLAIMSVLTGLELIGMGLAPKYVVITVLLALMGLGVGVVNVQFSSWVQLRVERAVLGRVMSVLMLAVVGLNPLSLTAAGALAEWNLNAVFILYGALLASASLLAIGGRAAREID